MLVLAGELDVKSAPDLLGAAREALAVADPVDAIVIDLAGLDFMDSSGLQALWRVREEAEDAGAELRLVRGGPDVHRVFELTGLEASFVFVDGAAV